jgi:hypothetical protein
LSDYYFFPQLAVNYFGRLVTVTVMWTLQDSAHLHKTRGHVKKWMEAVEAVETVGDQAYEDVLATVIINKVRHTV